jgi:SPP1 gp7 family putative phage head morphogenesis protein
LTQDVFLFSGAKTYVQLQQVSAQLLDADGNLKPFGKFKQDIATIDAAYNQRYLQTEYNYAVGTAQNAAKWGQYEAEQERYDLRYLTDNGPTVREAHRALEGTVLPVNDPFWDSYAPKNGWNCHCYVVQVRKGKYPLSDSAEALQKGAAATTVLDKNGNNAGAIFRFNPGKQQVIFPPKHPYHKLTPETAQQTLADLAEAGRKDWERQYKQSIFQRPVSEQYVVLHTNKQGGQVLQHVLADSGAGDFEDVRGFAQDFANEGKTVQILPTIHKEEREARAKLFPDYDRPAKSPDLRVDNEYWEVERTSGRNKRNINIRVKSGIEQADNVALILDDKQNKKYAESKLKDVAKKFIIK